MNHSFSLGCVFQSFRVLKSVWKGIYFFDCGHPIVPPDVDAKAHPAENSNKVLILLSSSSEHRLRCECGSENLLFMGTFLQSFKFISTFMPSEFKSATAIDLRTWYQLAPLPVKSDKKRYKIKVFFFWTPSWFLGSEYNKVVFPWAKRDDLTYR